MRCTAPGKRCHSPLRTTSDWSQWITLCRCLKTHSPFLCLCPHIGNGGGSSPNGKVTHHQLNCPISHYHPLSYAAFISQPHCTSERTHRERIHAHTQNHCRKKHTFSPCMAPAQSRVLNVCTMHDWTNSRTMTMFSPESRWRNCSDISALLLCATCWPGTFLTANFIWKSIRRNTPAEISVVMRHLLKQKRMWSDLNLETQSHSKIEPDDKF